MAGVLFIVNVPQMEYEKELKSNEKSSKIVMEKEKYEKASKVIHEMKKSKRFGSIAKSSIESYATDDDSSIVISKCRSTDCLNKNENEGLYKSKSENTLNDISPQSFQSSWDEVKQVIKAKKNKLNITRPTRGVDILGAFHFDTPLETILSEILTRLEINSASWTATKGNKFWKVTFSLKSGNLCEELLQVLKTFGIGSRCQSSMSVLPCTLYYKAGICEEETETKEDLWQSENSMWSRLSSSIRARNHLPQILYAVRAEASLTFDWLFLLVVAAFVSALGLVENSTVILVASMLISPLMGPITAGTLGTAVRDRSLQRMGVMHEMLGLFLSLVIGFIFGLIICAVDERYGVGDWPTYEMVSRCEIRSLWVGVLVAIPSGAAVALAVLSEYTASLVGVAISASLLPPAVNAGLLWSMSLVHVIYASDETRWNGVVTTSYYSENPATELALLGTVSLCLTLVNILCIFLAGVAVYKVKEVCPLDKRDIPWWRANRDLLEAPKRNDDGSATWDIYSKWCNDLETPKKQTENNYQIQSDTVTYRRHNIMQRPKALNIEDYCLQKSQNNESYSPTDADLKSVKDNEKKPSEIKDGVEAPSIISNADSIENNPTVYTERVRNSFNYYNFGFEDRDERNPNNDSYYPTIQPSLNLTIDAKTHGIVLGTKSFHV
ncbi:unnamed protein product [Chilo suppressalis]|uniref:DUF389 domain-containing protein n=1 Tax=Chilo suppressalis TaxID=168631 RepID=A0ABN8AXX4_CHISP|nr:unnamed protein product [Chilo suppressalis]